MLFHVNVYRCTCTSIFTFVSHITGHRELPTHQKFVLKDFLDLIGLVRPYTMPFFTGLGRTHISSVAIGMCLGIFISCTLMYTKRQAVVHTTLEYIPKSPHSHGENDLLKGPDVSLAWSDEHSHRHTSKKFRGKKKQLNLWCDFFLN